MDLISEELQMEIQSVMAIFPDELQVGSGPRQLTVHCASHVKLNLGLPVDYPSSPPSMELCAPSVSGKRKRQLLATLASICAQRPGEPVLYALIETTLEFFRENRHNAKETQPKNDKGLDAVVDGDEDGSASMFHSGPTIEDRKSKFQAHVAKLDAKEQIPGLLAQLNTVGKIARATHNTYAWRIVHDDLQQKQQRQIEQHDCDDDGENGAGAKLLRLLVQMNARGVLVVVSRWYGGRKLGPDRFRHICNAAREALIQGGFVTTSSNSTNRDHLMK